MHTEDPGQMLGVQPIGWTICRGSDLGRVYGIPYPDVWQAYKLSVTCLDKYSKT